MSLVYDLLAVIGAITVIWGAIQCVRSHDKLPPRVDHRPAWDERDRTVYFRNMERR